MSSGQQRMWLVHQTFPDPAAYHVPVAYRIAGNVDGDRLQQCLRILMERYEVLRTSLLQIGDRLVQRITPADEVALIWKEQDWRGIGSSELEVRLREEAREPFDLARVPLWRALWTRVDGDERDSTEHILLLTFHHALVDEWSLRVLVHELEQAYANIEHRTSNIEHRVEGRVEDGRRRAGEGGARAFASHPVDPVDVVNPVSKFAAPARQEPRPPASASPAEGMDYADFAVWQQSRLSDEHQTRNRSYWEKQLRPAAPALVIPGAKPPVARRTGCGGVYRWTLPVDLIRPLERLALQQGTSVFSLMLATFQVWLSRYSGGTDVVVGTPVSNRDRWELQDLVGFFLNTVPIRVRIEGQISFRETLGHVRRCVLDALDHADLPFEQIVQAALTEREGVATPLYQVMFVLVEHEIARWHLNEAPLLASRWIREPQSAI
jgi:hypothetical protein